MITKEKARDLCRIAYTFGYICGTDDRPMKEEEWIDDFVGALDMSGYEERGKKLVKETTRKMQEECWYGNEIWTMIADVYDDIMEEIE